MSKIYNSLNKLDNTSYIDEIQEVEKEEINKILKNFNAVISNNDQRTKERDVNESNIVSINKLREKKVESIKPKRRSFIKVASILLLLSVVGTLTLPIPAFANIQDAFANATFEIGKTLGIGGNFMNYSQVINHTVQKDGYTFKIDEILVQENNMIVEYLLQAPEGVVLEEGKVLPSVNFKNSVFINSGGKITTFKLIDKEKNIYSAYYLGRLKENISLVGKKIDVVIRGIDKGDKIEPFQSIVEFNDKFSFEVENDELSSKIKKNEVNKKIVYGEADYTLKDISISPLFINVTMDRVKGKDKEVKNPNLNFMIEVNGERAMLDAQYGWTDHDAEIVSENANLFVENNTKIDLGNLKDKEVYLIPYFTQSGTGKILFTGEKIKIENK